MKRSRALFAFIVFAAAMATTADAATVSLPGGTSVSVPNVSVPKLGPVPQVNVRVPDVNVQVPQVRLPSAPTGSQGPVQRLGRSIPGAGGVTGGGSGSPGSGVAGSPAGGSAGSAPGGASGGAAGSSAGAARSSRSRPLTARQRRVRAVRERKALRRGVRRYRGCLGVVSSFERQVLVLRSGLSGPAQSRSDVARSLGASVGRVTRGERSGLRGLRDAARSTGCAGGSAMSYSGSSSDQMASATVAVATGSAPTLQSVTTMAGNPDSQLASIDDAAAGQVLGARADSDDSSPTEELGSLTPAVAFLGDGEPAVSPAYLLLLLLLLIPLTILALRRRPSASSAGDAGYAPHQAPPASAVHYAAAAPPVVASPSPPASEEPLWDRAQWWSPPAPAEAAPSDPEPIPPAAAAEGDAAEREHATPAEPEEASWQPIGRWAAPEPAEPSSTDATPMKPAASASTPVPPAASANRRRQAAAVASGLASVVLGSLVSRRYRGRGRRRR